MNTKKLSKWNITRRISQCLKYSTIIGNGKSWIFRNPAIRICEAKLKKKLWVFGYLLPFKAKERIHGHNLAMSEEGGDRSSPSNGYLWVWMYLSPFIPIVVCILVGHLCGPQVHNLNIISDQFLSNQQINPREEIKFIGGIRLNFSEEIRQIYQPSQVIIQLQL